MIVEETKDINEIKSIICNNEVYARLKEDRAPTVDDFEPPENVQYIAGYINNVIFAIMTYHYDADRLKCHIQVLLEYRKKYARKFARMALKFGEAKNATIYTEIPVIYPEVIRFAKDFGFKAYGEGSPRSIDGVAVNVIKLRRVNEYCK